MKIGGGAIKVGSNRIHVTSKQRGYWRRRGPAGGGGQQGRRVVVIDRNKEYMQML